MGLKIGDKTMRNNHPHQPIVRVKGVDRFKKNPLVEYLLNAGGLDMNALALFACENSNVTKRDEAQFAQLIGYSVSGWGGLSYVTDTIYDEVEKHVHD